MDNETNDTIARQNKLKDLKARLREVLGELKRSTQSLVELNRGASGAYCNYSGQELDRLRAHYGAQVPKFEAAAKELGAKITLLEAQRPSIDSLPHAVILDFFDGNGREAARGALELVALSMVQDSWVPGASRRCWSALSAEKASKKLVAKDEAGAKAALYEVRKQMKRWDATRPAPTFTSLGASPTVTATLKSLEAVKVEVCPMEYVRVEKTDPKTGKVSYVTIVRLLWPAGTVFDSSKYRVTENNRQCQACGHAIKNTYNWVPLVLTDAKGTPKALWVGRDCAKTLFGIDMTGELEVTEN